MASAFKKSSGGTVIKYVWKGDNRLTELGKILSKRMDNAAEYIKLDIQNSFQSGPEPSDDGEIPAIQKGQLLGSISWDKGGSEKAVVRDRMGRFSFSPTRRIFSDNRALPGRIPYGVYLELGTTKMAARPYLLPAAVRNKAMVKTLMSSKAHLGSS